MIKVKFHAGWQEDPEKTKKWISKYTKDGKNWNDLKLTADDDYDYVVIFNHPHPSFRFDPKRAIVFQGEPAPIRNNWGKWGSPDPDKFFCLWDTPNHFNSIGWSFNVPWRVLKEMTITKHQLISGVISSKQHFMGQRLRLAFVRKYLGRIEKYVHYGRGTGIATIDKSDAIFPYKYTFNAENVREPNYFTEKLTDAIIGESLCFYDGCPNIEKFYHPDSYVKIDLEDMEKSFQMVLDAMNGNLWESRLPAIQEQKHRILDELQPMPLVEKIIKDRS
jgi:hypothetical protein